VLYGALLVDSDFLPYVVDNNESFSAFVHGKNMYEHGTASSRWLTDEAYGSDAAAHPYVYTHQGNFPRVFSFVLYTLGARSVESQIVITTFTVGLATVLLIALFFTRLVTPGFGILAALVFLTDYVLFAQWQVNSYRAWHGLLLFAALVATQAELLRDARSWKLILAVGASFACIAYFDLLIAVFSLVLVVAFAFLSGTSARRRSLMIVAAVFAGSAVGFGILLTQLLAYYGLEGLIHDVRYTFSARNLASYTSGQGIDVSLWYSDMHVVFWERFVSGSLLRPLPVFLSSFTRFGWITYTPLLALILMIVIVGGVTCCLASALSSVTAKAQSLRFRRILLGLLVGAACAVIVWSEPRIQDGINGAILATVFGALAAYWLANSSSLVRGAVRFAGRVARHAGALRAFLAVSLLASLFLFCAAAIAPGVVVLSLALWFGVLSVVLFGVHAFGISEQYRYKLDSSTLSAREPVHAALWLAPGVISLLLVHICAAFFLFTVLASDRLAALSSSPSLVSPVTSPMELATVFLSGSLGIGVMFAWLGWPLVFPAGLPGARVEARCRMLDKLLFCLFCVSVVCWSSPWFFSSAHQLEPFWRDFARSVIPGKGAPRIVVVISCIAACYMAAGDALPSFVSKRLAPLGAYLAAGVLGYAAAYYFAPGYMAAVHLERFSPVLVYLVAPMAALAVWLLGHMLLTAFAPSGSTSRRTFAVASPRYAAAAITLAVVTAYWPALQKTYYAVLPPDAGAIYKKLREPPYSEHSFIVNTYAAPTAASTGSWAYINPPFFEGAAPSISSNRYTLPRSETYLWFADRDAPRYAYPDYALCFLSPDVLLALSQGVPTGRDEPVSMHSDRRGCYRLASLVASAYPHPAPKLVDYDHGLLSRWAILELPRPPGRNLGP
jgi:hypothetical protein